MWLYKFLFSVLHRSENFWTSLVMKDSAAFFWRIQDVDVTPGWLTFALFILFFYFSLEIQFNHN